MYLSSVINPSSLNKRKITVYEYNLDLQLHAVDTAVAGPLAHVVFDPVRSFPIPVRTFSSVRT